MGEINTLNNRTAITHIAQEIIPIEHGNLGLMIDARLLHEKLGIETRLNDWIQRRIDEYKFVENEDFERFYSNLSKTSGGRPAKEYFITLDMAKELAMVERNHYGRAIRRYFIEIEKQYRDWIGFVLPRLQKDVDLFSEKIGYNYCQLLKAVELSTSKPAQRRRQRQYPREFWKSVNGVVFVSESYGKTIIAHAAARKLSRKTKYRNLLL